MEALEEPSGARPVERVLLEKELLHAGLHGSYVGAERRQAIGADLVRAEVQVLQRHLLAQQHLQKYVEAAVADRVPREADLGGAATLEARQPRGEPGRKL